MSLTAEDRWRSDKLAQVHTRLMAAFGKPDWHELMPAVD